MVRAKSKLRFKKLPAHDFAPFRKGKLLSISMAVLVQILVPCVVGGYMQGAAPARLVHEAILSLCRELKDDAVSLVDVIAPPDFILNSPIGTSDGQVSHLIPSNAEATFIQSTRTQNFQKTIWTLLCGYSLESSCWALSYEYPFARFSVNVSSFFA